MSYQDPEHVDDKWRDEYWPDFRKHAHELLILGYKVAKFKVKQWHDETDITGFIAEAIQERLDSPGSPDWYNQFALHEDPPVPGGNRTGRRRRRPDLIFESVVRRPRPKYFFESKRLRKQSTYRESYYLGGEGLQRFLNGIYAGDYTEAGMLGYVQCDTVDQWVDRLKIAIEDDANSDNKLLLKSPQRGVRIIDEIPQEWVSEHDRYTGGSIIIYHILFDCCS